jgi:hypothetical protein
MGHSHVFPYARPDWNSPHSKPSTNTISTVPLKHILTRCILTIIHTDYEKTLKRDLFDFLVPECRWATHSETLGVRYSLEVFFDGHSYFLPWDHNIDNLAFSIKVELTGHEQQPLLVTLSTQSHLITETEGVTPLTGTEAHMTPWTNSLDLIFETMHMTDSEPHDESTRCRTLSIRRSTDHIDSDIYFTSTVFIGRILATAPADLVHTNPYSFPGPDMDNLVRHTSSDRDTLIGLTEGITSMDNIMSQVIGDKVMGMVTCTPPLVHLYLQLG